MLRLMTLNLNFRMDKHGPWPVRRRLIAQAIRRCRADVVALQAAEDSAHGSQTAEIAALVEFDNVVFVGATRHNGTTRGSGFIARRRLRHLGPHALGRRGQHDDPNRRVLVKVQTPFGKERLDIYNAHFSWVPEQALDNAQETIAWCAPGPSILLGDLNNVPDSPALTALRGAGWVDAWSALRPDDPGYTFESDRPTQRIDYVLASAELQTRLRSIEQVQADAASGARLSDHLGLVVEIDEASTAS